VVLQRPPHEPAGEKAYGAAWLAYPSPHAPAQLDRDPPLERFPERSVKLLAPYVPAPVPARPCAAAAAFHHSFSSFCGLVRTCSSRTFDPLPLPLPHAQCAPATRSLDDDQLWRGVQRHSRPQRWAPARVAGPYESFEGLAAAPLLLCRRPLCGHQRLYAPRRGPSRNAAPRAVVG
jgi:hypothetical protein